MRNRIALVAAIVVFGLCISSLRAADLMLANNGKSDYKIVTADNASPCTKHAAEELQKFLQQITGVKLPIITDKQPKGPKEIIIGSCDRLKGVDLKLDLATLGKEGYLIRGVGDNLVIIGGPLRGNLYGVYGFLEDHLGCRWFTPTVSRIPKLPLLVVGALDDKQIPALEYREPLLADCYDGDWCARNRMNSSAGRLEEKHGGKVKFGDGFFCHTFNGMVPPDKYFKEHPEYFSLVKGKRLGENTQLCCTNPDVIRLCTEAVQAARRAQPQSTVFSVSQNDWDNHCECDACQALAKEEDSQMAPVLQLVNSVAKAVEKEFPDKIVETLAYQWTRKAPKELKPRPNVVIRLCSIECCFSHPLATCDSPQNKAFCADVETWAKLAPRLWVWDYTTDFPNYLLPFPNQHVLGPNIRFFVAHNVKGIFEEDTYQTTNSEMAELDGYLMAKALWNPKYDLNRGAVEFLIEYYVEAAAPIRQYLDMLHKRVEREKIHVNIWAQPDSPHLTDELLIKANELWQEAEDLTSSSPIILRRVKLSRMSVDYAIVERARLQAQKKLPANETFQSLAAERFKPFMEVLKSSNLTHLREGPPFDKEAYRRDLAKDLQIEQ